MNLSRLQSTLSILLLLSLSSPSLGAGVGDDIFDEIMAWTQREIKDAGGSKVADDGSEHSNIFVGDNARYDGVRGEVKRVSFIEGELFKSSNIAITGEMSREVIEEIKLSTTPQDWYAQINQAQVAIGKQSLDNWYQELAECKTVCAQIVVRMMAKHFEAISNLPHFFVRFRTGSDSIDNSYDPFLKQIGDYLGIDPTLKILVIGRASRTGDRAFNRELSRKRADSIKYKLMLRNVDPDRIKVVYLGYEPPQLTQNIIDLYRVDSAMVNLNHPIDGLTSIQMNQSAIVAFVKI